MKKRYILIDSVYINSGGGKEILNHIIKYILDKHDINKYFFLLDERLELKNKQIDFLQIHANEKNRKNFYLSNKNNFNSIVCMSNVPPPINIENVPVSVYFHNDLFLNPIKSNVGVLAILKNLLKKQYIKYKNKKKYSWIVQTKLMKTKLEKFLNIKNEKIKTLPIIEFQEYKTPIKKKNKFVFVSNFSNHKNHFKLFQAFKDACKEKSYNIELNLTIDKNIYIKSFYCTGKKPRNLKIINHGIISTSQVREIYSSSEFLIFPSLNESLGMPLIEAIFYGCKVLAPNLNYVGQVITPSLTFDPYSVSSISESIQYAVENNIKNSEIIIENKIDTFVKHINIHV
jgi:glycosyltransferase involved in cell wall biosynthesis